MADNALLGCPRLSIIIPMKNRAHSIPHTLQSLGKLMSVAEVVVVDDRSNDLDDATCHMVSAIADIFVTGLQGGANACRNLGAAISCGEILWFLDSDDLALPDNIIAALDYIDATESNDIWFADFRWVKDIYGIPRPGYRDTAYISESIRYNLRHALYHHWIATPCVFIPRVVFDEVGGFDIKRSSGQETDLLRRLGEQGVGFIHIPIPVFIFMRHNGQSIVWERRRDARYDAVETMSTYLCERPGDKALFRNKQWANRIVTDELLCPRSESSRCYATILARKYRPRLLILLKVSGIFPKTASKTIWLYRYLRKLLRTKLSLEGLPQGVKWLIEEPFGREFSSRQKKLDVFLHNYRYFHGLLKIHRLVKWNKAA